MKSWIKPQSYDNLPPVSRSGLSELLLQQQLRFWGDSVGVWINRLSPGLKSKHLDTHKGTLWARDN